MNLAKLITRQQHSIGTFRSLSHLRFCRNASSVSKTNEDEPRILSDDELEAKNDRDAEIEKKRNKSRLYPDHYETYHGRNPYLEPVTEYHSTLRYKRRLFGKYGESSAIDPSVLWLTKQELDARKEYDALAYPHTIPELVKFEIQKKQAEAEAKLKREADVMAKVAKIEHWKKEFHEKIRKKNQEVIEAKQRKDRLVEEIRRHFGFKIDPRDDRFKEMMEKKEKEAKKLNKAERQKTRDMKLLAEAQAAEDRLKDASREEKEAQADLQDQEDNINNK